MNQQQRNYTMKRVSEIEKRKIEEARNSATTEGIVLSGKAKLQALKEGKFTINELDNKPYIWYTCVEFDDEIKRSVDKDKQQKLISKVQKEATRIRDELMIGDCEEALSMLKDFEKSS